MSRVSLTQLGKQLSGADQALESWIKRRAEIIQKMDMLRLDLAAADQNIHDWDMEIRYIKKKIAETV